MSFSRMMYAQSKHLSRQLIAKVHMKNNRMFPLKTRSDLKEEVVIAAVTQENFQK